MFQVGQFVRVKPLVITTFCNQVGMIESIGTNPETTCSITVRFHEDDSDVLGWSRYMESELEVA